MDKQMQLFEEGGLNQEGGMIDEVSGNDVPVGSTREEVRDDIPAQLSEGEFVFPADVTRYIGLDKLMQLRQQAKMGLKKMEAMGQMGNSDEATLPDDLPFGMEDLIIIQAEGGDEPQEFNQGGMPVNPNTGVYYTNNTGVTMQPPTQRPSTGGIQPSPQPTMPSPPTQPTGGATGGYQPLFMQGQPPVTAPTFSTLMEGAELSYKTYINADGETILVPFVGDNALYPIPEGYFEKGSTDDPTTDTGEEATGGDAVEAAAQDDDRGPAIVEPSAFQKAGGWGMDTSGKDGVALDMWIKEAQKVTGQGNVVTGILGAINPLMGAAAWAANKHQKKQITAMLDEKIAQARLTPVEGQVAALLEIKDNLENGGNKGILGEVVDSISDAIGLGEKEKEVVKANVNAAASETGEDTPEPEKEVPPITTLTGESFYAGIKDAGFDTPSAYAAEIERRMRENNSTQEDVIKEAGVSVAPIEDVTTSAVTPSVGEDERIVSVDEAARANRVAGILKNRGVTRDTITATEFDLIKGSADAKRELGIAPTIMTYSDVKTNGTTIPRVVTETEPELEAAVTDPTVETTLGETSVIDTPENKLYNAVEKIMDFEGLVTGTRLGDKLPFNLMGFATPKTTPESSATQPIVPQDSFEPDMKAIEEAAEAERERLKKQEEDLKKQLEQQQADQERVRKAMEAAAKSRRGTEYMLGDTQKQKDNDDEQFVFSQPVKSKEATESVPFKTTQTEAQKKASDVGFGSPTGGWTPEGFNFNTGGLLQPKVKTKSKPKSKRGLAARKK